MPRTEIFDTTIVCGFASYPPKRDIQDILDLQRASSGLAHGVVTNFPSPLIGQQCLPRAHWWTQVEIRGILIAVFYFS